MNRLTAVKLNGSGTAALQFAYDDLSRRTSITYGNGVVTNYTYNWDDTTANVEHVFSGSSVEFDYGYDNVQEVTSQSVNDAAFMWHPASGGTVTYGTADDVNAYPTVGGVTQTVDDNGCLTGDGTWTFTYDTEQHVVSATDGTTTVSFVYDGQHRQHQKTVGAAKTRFIYSGWQRIADYNGAMNALQNRFVYGTGLDEPLIIVSSGGTLTYLHHDKLGSVIATSDGSGVNTNKNKFGPFGETPSLAGTSSFGYTGQRYDSEFDLYYFKRRYYSTKTGRFMQPDPAGYKYNELNLYPYASNSPFKFVDPFGLKQQRDIHENLPPSKTKLEGSISDDNEIDSDIDSDSDLTDEDMENIREAQEAVRDWTKDRTRDLKDLKRIEKEALKEYDKELLDLYKEKMREFFDK